MVTQEKLDKVVEFVTQHLIKNVLTAKAGDYAKSTDDRLRNFKHQGRIDGVEPIDALRGNWLKHRASVQEAIQEVTDKCYDRNLSWLEEKFGDSINYHILALAMIIDEHHPAFFERESLE